MESGPAGSRSGRTLGSRAREGDRALRVFAGLASLHALVQVVCVGSATLGVPVGRGSAIAALALSLVLAVVFASRLALTSVPPSGGATDASRAQGGSGDGLLIWPVRVLAVAGVFWATSMWVRLWELAYRRPSYDWDGLYYHIPAIHEWVRAGRILWIDGHPDVPFVNYPMAVEANAFLLHQAHGMTRIVDACNLWFWPLAFFSVVVLAGTLGARGVWRWLAGAVLVGAPVLVCRSVTCYIDPGFAACLMAAVAASVLLVFRDVRPAGAVTLLWGMCVGLVLGAKGTGLPMAGVLCAAVLVAGLVRERGDRWRVWLLRVGVGIVIALAVGGYWYARAFVHTGNPLHPIQLRFGNRVIAPGYDHEKFTAANLPPFLEEYPEWARPCVSWLQLDAPISMADAAGGLGYVWPAAELPAIALLAAGLLRRRPGRPRAKLAFALCLVLVLFLVQPASWSARFTIWLHVLGLSCLAVGLHRLFSAGGVVRRILVLLCSLAVLGVAAWDSERTLALERENGLVAHDEEGRPVYETPLRKLYGRMADKPGFDRFLAAEKIARSRWGRFGARLGGILAMPLGRREIYKLPAEPNERDLLRVRRAGVQWVVWHLPDGGEVPEVLGRQALERHAHGKFRVLRLPPPPE